MCVCIRVWMCVCLHVSIGHVGRPKRPGGEKQVGQGAGGGVLGIRENCNLKLGWDRILPEPFLRLPPKSQGNDPLFSCTSLSFPCGRKKDLPVTRNLAFSCFFCLAPGFRQNLSLQNVAMHFCTLEKQIPQLRYMGITGHISWVSIICVKTF